jgi:hypothetical protein
LDYVLLLTEPTTTFMGEAFFEFATCELLIINLVLPRFKWNKKMLRPYTASYIFCP